MSEDWTTAEVRQACVYSDGQSAGDGFDRWLAAHDRKARAEAWYEGHRADSLATNPHIDGMTSGEALDALRRQLGS